MLGFRLDSVLRYNFQSADITRSTAVRQNDTCEDFSKVVSLANLFSFLVSRTFSHFQSYMDPFCFSVSQTFSFMGCHQWISLVTSAMQLLG